MSISSGEIVELKIEKLTFQGAGLARYDNFVVFVPNSCPGDIVSAKIVKRKPSYAEGEITNIILPSPFRKPAPCPYFSECGGCQWQHIDYSTQTHEKEKIIREYFQKQLKDSFNHSLTIEKSNKEYHYRNRIRLHWDGVHLGYFKKGTNQIVPISACLLADEKINSLIPAVKKELSEGHKGRFCEVDFFINSSHQACYKILPKDSPAMPFRQVNDYINHALLNQTRKQILLDIGSVFDLYCGEGNFSFFIAESWTGSVFGIDSNKDSIKRANTFKTEKTCSNLEFIHQDVLGYLRALKAIKRDVCFILDPPRTGCAPELISEILRLRPTQILFISCDPPTLARDLRALMNSYSIKSVFAFDMFPQTFHMECLVSLSLKPL